MEYEDLACSKVLRWYEAVIAEYGIGPLGWVVVIGVWMASG